MNTTPRTGHAVILLILVLVWMGCQPEMHSQTLSTIPFTPAVLPVKSTISPTNTPIPTSIPIQTIVRKSDSMIMVYIPEGKFIMGGAGGEADEGPIHDVYLNGFWIDTTEVTNEMYGLCVESGSCKQPMETSSYTRASYYDNKNFAKYPVIFVDWGMANVYCHWADARLPTESEWEKSARGVDGRIFPWGNKWDVAYFKRLNFADRRNSEMAFDMTIDDGYRDTSPVGSFPSGASPYGIYDLDGNVWEWVADWYDPQYYNYSPLDNPQGPESPIGEVPMRSMRGGGWVAANDLVFHTYNRHGVDPYKFSSSIGFRCAQ